MRKLLLPFKYLVVFITNQLIIVNSSMNRKFRKTALLMSAMALLGLGYSSNAYAAGDVQNVQQATKKITGTISDSQGPVIGASVVEKGTSNGVVTDFDGNFTLNVKPGATLVISYIGYTTKEIAVGNQSIFNVTIEEDNNSLDEVVVIGYGVQKKKLVTGATVQVKGEDIAKLNTTNALEAMQSSTPGVQITQSSSQPGKGYKVYIRGIGTTGNSAPLYVIDGVAGGSLDDINPADIESIDILKDAASAAIYGARAANGVILVTTRQGKAGKIELSYNGAFGWSNAYKRPQLLNAQQYMTIIDEYTFNTSGQKMDWAGYVPADILAKVNSGWEGTDWWKAFENKNALQQNHSVTLTGGNDMSKFAMSYTYTGNERPRISMPSPSVRISLSATTEVTTWLRTACTGAISTACSRLVRSCRSMLTMATSIIIRSLMVTSLTVMAGTLLCSATRTRTSIRVVSILWQRAATSMPMLLLS